MDFEELIWQNQLILTNALISRVSLTMPLSFFVVQFSIVIIFLATFQISYKAARQQLETPYQAL
jgi:hypothetical protein